MPTYFQRPENALKRADEFIEVGKKQRALDALYDVIKSKKHRTWQKIHEPIMKKYLALCVELRKSHIAKEGLYQYKNICQQVNIKSLEDVVREYLNLAEQQTENARQESQQQVIDVDDLDILQTPESLLLSAVSGEDTQDRTDRAILTPWVKFLWESYRQCLDLLRNNNRVERLYQDIAQLAFKFCLKYARKTEFRKLCDNLRTHLGHIHKHQNQQTAINLNNPESQAMHLETRLVQLDSAVEMDLWQEAFKAVEDVHGLINISKKPPKPSIMANYYQKFGIIFYKSNNHLFHAAAWHKLYQLSMEQRKNMSQAELKKLSSRVLCATLAVPLPPTRNNVDQLLENNFAEKQRRLATLLGLPNPPSRVSLVKDLARFNIVQYVPVDLQNLYRWLEVEFHPLKLSERVQECMKYVEKSEDLAMYVPALQELTVIRLLKQVSQVYMTIGFQRFASLAPFATAFELEKIIVQAARNIDLQVRVDHRTRSLSFGTDLCVSQREDVKEGPSIQNMPSEHIRLQLCSLGNALAQAVEKIQPKSEKDQDEELRKRIAMAYRQTAQKDHVRILSRRQIIEDRKEELEQKSFLKEQEEQELQMEQERKLKDAEEKRLAREREERAKQRRLEEHRDIQRKHAKERLEQLKKSEVGARAFADIDEEELADLDADEILAKQVEQLEKEKKELNDRLKSQEKKVDHLARAKRLEELPLLAKSVEEKLEKAEEFWVQQENERIEQLKREREVALQHKERLTRMVEDKNSFLDGLKAARISVYKEKLKSFEKNLNEERRKRLAERKERRREERRAKWYQEKEEAEQTAREEALKREHEEKERLEKEKEEHEQKAYEEKLKKLEEQAAKQREREREIEMRAEQKKAEALREQGRDREDKPAVGPWRPGAREGGWRAREKEREDSWRKSDEPGRDEGRVRRDEPPPRDEGRWGRDEPRSRDEGRWGRDEPPPRDEGRWRRDEPPPRDEGRWRRDEPPRRDEDRFKRDDYPPRDEGRWRRDDPPPRDEGRWRRDDPPPRDEGRWRRDEPPARDEGRWRRDEPTARDESRWKRDNLPARDFRRDAPPSDRWRRSDDRDAPSDDRGPSSDDRWSRGPPRDDRGARDDDGPWRRGGPPRDDRDAFRRDDERRRGPPRDDGPRRDERSEDEGPWRRGPPKPREGESQGGDGWTTVRH